MTASRIDSRDACQCAVRQCGWLSHRSSLVYGHRETQSSQNNRKFRVGSAALHCSCCVTPKPCTRKLVKEGLKICPVVHLEWKKRGRVMCCAQARAQQLASIPNQVKIALHASNTPPEYSFGNFSWIAPVDPGSGRFQTIFACSWAFCTVWRSQQPVQTSPNFNQNPSSQSSKTKFARWRGPTRTSSCGSGKRCSTRLVRVLLLKIQ